MKYLLLLMFMSGCSLISIKEGAPEPKHRPEIITLEVSDKNGDGEPQISIVRLTKSKILVYSEHENKCAVVMEGAQYALNANMTCSELDELLNQ